MSLIESSQTSRFQRILPSNNPKEFVLKLLIIITISFFLLLILVSANSCENDSFDAKYWKDCSGCNWQIDISEGHISPPSLSSASIENSGKSSICFEVKGPAIASFWWKIDAKKGGLGQLSFWVNDTKNDTLKYVCDSDTWKYESYSLREKRNYTLKWEFIKFKSYPKNIGAGWIDEICIKPASKENSSSTIFNYVIYDEIKSDELNSLNNESKLNIIYINKTVQQLETDKLPAHPENNITYVSRFGDSRNQTYTSINEAIQNLAKNGIVKVSSGTYRENIIINKPLTLLGEGKTTTFIKSDNDVIYVAADDVVIKGFTILGGDIGIDVIGASNSIIMDNIISLNSMYGIFLEDCINATISSNDISDVGDTGVYLVSSYGSKLIGNIISDASELSVCIGGSSGGSYRNMVFNNTFIHSIYGIKIMSGSHGNIIGDGYNKNYFKNITDCDINLTNCDEITNSLPLICKGSDSNWGCRLCQE